MFRNTQSCLLKETSQYLKTRYEIITLALKRVIQTNKAFAEFLLLMTMLDSQSIPKAVFSDYKTTALTDRFIHELKKYSIITDQSMPEGYPVFSIHRSTRELSYAYLVELLKLTPDHPMVQDLKRKVASFVYKAIDEEQRPLIRILKTHGECIMQSHLLTTSEKMKIMGMLGCIYYIADQREKARNYLEKSIDYVEINIPRNKMRLGRLYLHLARCYQVLDYEKSQMFFKKSARAYQSARFKEGEINALIHLGLLYNAYGDYKNAKEIAQQFLTPSARKKLTKDNLIRILRCLGSSQRELGFYEESLKSLNEEFQTRKKYHPEDERMAWALVNIFWVYSDLGDIENGSRYITQALEAHKMYNKNSPIFWDLKIIAANWNRQLGKYELALPVLKETISLYEKSHQENTIRV